MSSETQNTNIQYKSNIMPLEETLEIMKKKRSFTIGLPCEKHKYETRISLTPLAVKNLVDAGHTVIVETNAGAYTNFTDMDYSEAGAQIASSKEAAFEAEVLLKINTPTVSEYNLLAERQIIFSMLDLTRVSREYIHVLAKKKISAISYELIKCKENYYPVNRAMDEISGSSSILIASEYLSNVHNGKGVLLGGVTGITPTEIIIIGAGTIAEFAARTALGLGASVKVFDLSAHKLRQLQNNVGQRLFTSILHPKVLKNTLRTADVVIGALEFDGNSPRFIVSEDIVKSMKRNSVIIDLAISQGGCFETSHVTNFHEPTFVKHGVIHYCIPNVPARVARTATIALSDIIGTVVYNLGEAGSLNQFLREDFGIRKGVYTYHGILTNDFIGSELSLPSPHIDLLLPHM